MVRLYRAGRTEAILAIAADRKYERKCNNSSLRPGKSKKKVQLKKASPYCLPFS